MKALGKPLVGLGKLCIGLGKLLACLGKLLKAGKWLIFISALGALVAGCWLLVKVWQGQPVAAAFTRVGGETHVETALEASRFWTEPPRRVVAVLPGADQQTMLGAAQCAMAYDAPLLFRSLDPKRERMVDATITNWGLDPHGRDVINVGDPNRCLPARNRAGAGKLSAYHLPSLPLPRPEPARVHDELAPVAVFAAEWAPGFPPDIAVGLASAAHLARAYGRVSLVVVPRYPEANSELDGQLRKQRELVKGGIILGDQKILSEDARALLRQLLTSTNEQAVLGEIRTNLGLIAPLITALLALFALGMEPKIGKKLVRFGHKVEAAGQRQEINGQLLEETGWSIVMPFRKNGNRPPQPTPLPEADWLKVLDKDRVVTVWLRDGPRFAGTVDDGHLSATVLRLKNVNLTELEPTPKPENPLLVPAADRTADVLVPWGDIRLISVDAPAPAAAETPRPAGTAAAA